MSFRLFPGILGNSCWAGSPWHSSRRSCPVTQPAAGHGMEGGAPWSRGPLAGGGRHFLGKGQLLLVRGLPADTPSPPQARLATGRTISPWRRARHSTPITSAAWRGPACTSGPRSRARPAGADSPPAPGNSAAIKVYLLTLDIVIPGRACPRGGSGAWCLRKLPLQPETGCAHDGPPAPPPRVSSRRLGHRCCLEGESHHRELTCQEVADRCQAGGWGAGGCISSMGLCK